MRTQLFEVLQHLGATHPELHLTELEPLPANGGTNVATLKTGKGCVVWVSLLGDVASTDVVRQGLLAHQRMQDQPMDRAVNVVVIPNVNTSSPIVMSTRVVITNLDPEVIAAGLQRIAQRGCHNAASGGD